MWQRYSYQTVGTLSVTQAVIVVEEVLVKIGLDNREVIRIARKIVEYIVIEQKCSYTQLVQTVDLVYSVYSSTTVVSEGIIYYSLKNNYL